MPVFRVQKDKSYTVMSNFHFKEKEMSLKAKGLLSLMLSLPDTWDYSLNGLVAICKENETAVKSGLKELKEFGYLEVHKRYPNKENGGLIEYEYEIREQPIRNQGVENLGVDNLPVENRTQLSANQLSTKSLSTSKAVKPPSSNGAVVSFSLSIFNKQLKTVATRMKYNKDHLNDAIEVFDYFFNAYSDIYNDPHPKVSNDTLKYILQTMWNVDTEQGMAELDYNTYVVVIDEYFQQDFNFSVKEYGYDHGGHNLAHLFKADRVREICYLRIKG